MQTIQHTHKAEIIGAIPADPGLFLGIQATPDNRSYIAYFRDYSSHEQEAMKNGKPLECELVDENDVLEHRVYVHNMVFTHHDECTFEMAISHDGMRVATAQQRTANDGEIVWEICINGDPTYRVELDTIARLVWIGHKELAWSAYNDVNSERGKNDESGMRYFINGKDETKDFSFCTFHSHECEYGTTVRTKFGNICQDISPDGTRGKSFIAGPFGAPWGQWPTKEQQESYDTQYPRSIHLCPEGGGVQVEFRGKRGPLMEEHQNGDAYNQDHTKVAYIGVHSPALTQNRWVRSVNWVFGIMAKCFQQYWDNPKNRNRTPRSPLIWIFTLLANPYFGPVHLMYKMIQRRFVYDHHRRWEHGYKAVSKLLYTPSDQLVALVHDTAGSCVVIDQSEGPWFKKIHNVRYIPGEHRLSYLAQKDEQIIHVSVTLE